MNLVQYDPDAHFDAVKRIWHEVGWVEEGNDRHIGAMRDFIAESSGWVALLDDEPEAFGHWTPGTFWYVDRQLTMCAVTAITTSRIARKQGFASGLTARCLLDGREDGFAVAALGIFDQGFYDRFGFGSGAYEQRFSLDPASLTVDMPYRTPVRLGPDDYEEVHRVMTNRFRAHGSCTLDPVAVVKSELKWLDNPFGLGFRDADGRLTHFVFGTAKGEQGPYTLQWWGYETKEQFLELLRLVKELSDQVASVVIWEPPGVQMQDFIDRPFRQRTRTIKSDHETSHRAAAFWQMRILDLDQCIGARVWRGPELRFHLALTDPIASIEPGVDLTGDYVITLGEESGVEEGTGDGLPTLAASVNAFTRMWMGVRTPSTLSMSDDLDGPPELMAALDEAFGIPEPRHGWFF